jgi:SPP1 gp7 family putative phage head morphogenesis protein
MEARMVNKNSRSFRRDPSMMAGRIKRYEKRLEGLIEDARTELESLVDTGRNMERALESDLNLSLLQLHLNRILLDRILTPAERLAKDEVTLAYRAGGTRADQLLGINVNANLVNMPADKSALSVLQARSLTGLKGITDEMSKSIMQEITDGMLRGSSPREVAKAISERVDVSQSRAVTIARTESMKGYNTGATTRYKQRGVERVEWLATTSERTCPECMALDGRTFPLDDSPDMPAHVNCLLPGTRLKAPGGLVAGYRAMVDGQAVEMVVSDGSRLSVTENHMLLTPQGFSAANLLREGDYVCCCPGFEGGPTADPYENAMPPTVEEIFGSLNVAGRVPSRSVPIAPEHLHGDGRIVDGNVDIVFSDSLLRGAFETTELEQVQNDGLTPGRMAEIDLLSFSPLTQILIRAAHASDSIMGGARKSSPFFTRRLAHPEIHRLATPTRNDAHVLEPLDDGRAGGSEMFGQPLYRIAGLVKASQIVEVNTYQYHGPVYDFQTISSLCICNSIVTSNCRCCWLPVIPKLEDL